MRDEPRVFTLQQANRLLPEVRELVGRIVELVQFLPELEEQDRIARYQAARAGAGAREKEAVASAGLALEGAQLELAKAALGLQELGLMLKDPQLGLVDFPALREGELVELCWKLGEEQVSHWHRVGEGFAGRKPL